MAFLSRVGSILKQSVSKQIWIGSQISASNSSIYQALRCMSTSKVFVGGLPWAVDDSSLREVFSKYGDVIDAKVIIDREQDRSRGFGFVTFASTEEASSAIQAMDGQDLQGRRVTVNYAAERPPRSFGGGFGGGGYGGGGGGYGSGGYGGGGGGGGYDGGQQNYGGGQQNYGGGGGYGGQYGGGNSGGYEGGVAGGSSDSFYGGGGNNGGNEGGVAGGSGDSFYGGGGDVSADPGLGGPVGNDAGDFDPSGQPQGNFRGDEPEDFEKRA